MLVVGFYTNEKYRQAAEEMKASAEAVGLKCILTEKPDLGTWWQNANQKSAFVVESLERYGDEPILYQDADTRFVKYPKLLDTLQEDMAAMFTGPRTPQGGTLWFNGKERALRYVEAWAKTVHDNPTREDDTINFREAIQSIQRPRIMRLPPAYCWNEKTMRSAYPGVKYPVIIHDPIGDRNYPIPRL